MKLKLSHLVKKYKVASSRRHPDTGEILCYWTVELESDGSLYCNCPAGSFKKKKCRHIQIVEKHLQCN